MSARYIVEPFPEHLGNYVSRVLQAKFTHCVKDTAPSAFSHGGFIFQGTEEDCIAYAEMRNLQWAQMLMTIGTKAEGVW